MLHLVNISRDNVVTLESDLGTDGNFAPAVEELRASTAKEVARTKAAEQGVHLPNFSLTTPYAYPVDANGNVVEDPNGAIHRYRIDFKLSASIA